MTTKTTNTIAFIDSILRLKRDTLGPQLLSDIKEIYTRQNPAYDQMAYLRESNPHKFKYAPLPPKLIVSYTETKDEILLPRGTATKIVELVAKHSGKIEFINGKRQFDPDPDMMLSGVTLNKYQADTVTKALIAQQGIITAPCGCLSGDTLIPINRRGGGQKIRIDKLVKKLNESVSGGQLGGRSGSNCKWNSDFDTYVQSNFGGFVKLNKIKSAWYSGIKTTYTVKTVCGKSIRATLEHPFLTDKGWKKLSEIKVGDKVSITYGRKSEKSQIKSRQYKRIYLSKHPFCQPGCKLVPVHRLVAEAYINNITTEEFITKVKNGKIDGLKFLDTDIFAVHHIDGDNQNNDLNNLQILTHEEHHKLHAEEGYKNNYHIKTKLSSVISIDKYGDEETYDIEVENDPHNFIANDFVVHNSGKTVMGIALAMYARQPTLVVTHTHDLLSQWGREVAEKTTCGHRLGVVGGGKRKVDQITIATVQTLSRMVDEELDDFLDKFGCIILDECHHTPATTFLGVVNRCKAAFRYGFTATPKRHDKLEFLMYDVFGDVIAEVTDDDLLEAGRTQSVDVVEIATNFYSSRGADDWTALVGEICGDKSRNQIIINKVHESWEAGHFPLILSDRVGHVKYLTQELSKRGMNAYALIGEVKKETRETIVKLAKENKLDAIVATKVADEGLDIPNLSCLHLTTPTKNEGRLQQRIGRIRRPVEGKRSLVYDYVDWKTPTLLRRRNVRLKLYKQWGFQVKPLSL